MTELRPPEHVIKSLECMKTCLNARALLVSTETTQEAIDTIRRLQAIVDRLPKTADGVPVIPWMSDLYVHVKPFGVLVGLWNEHLSLTVETPEGSYSYYAPEMYSTREAAEKARKA
jgi:hypothetical protein